MGIPRASGYVFDGECVPVGQTLGLVRQYFRFSPAFRYTVGGQFDTGQGKHVYRKKAPAPRSRRSAGQAPHGTCFGRGATRGRSAHHWRIASAFLTVAVSVCVTARAQTFHFVEVQSARGIGNYYMSNGFGAGVAAADFDSGGDIDLVQVCADGPLRLLENRREKGSGATTWSSNRASPGPITSPWPSSYS